MHTTLELVLSHDGDHWLITDTDHSIHAQDLERLQEKISYQVKNEPHFCNQKTIDVTLLFDMNCFPRWLTQYQSHYFNYTFKVNR